MLTRLTRLVAVAVLAGAGVVAPLSSGTAWADESISRYDVQLRVNADGSLHVREQILYDFGAGGRHGIFRTIPVRYTYDDARDRVVEVSNVVVTSPSGAPTGLESSEDAGVLTLRVGDPNTLVTGQQAYVLAYDVRGATNGFPDHAEVFWNAIGTEWSASITRATVTVSGPSPPTQAACYAGPDGSGLPCTSSRIAGGGAGFLQDGLAPFQGLTVAVAFPKAAVAVPPPMLVERFSVVRAFAVTGWTVAGALVVLLVALFGIGWFAWTRGRDRRWRGQVPGLEPASGQADDESATEPRPLFTGPEGAVEFVPPEGVRPGQVGTLLDEQANPLDVTATIVDLAVRGYLRIEELPREHWFSGRDWRMVEGRPADADLLAYERTLLAAVFKDRSEVLVSELRRTFAADLGHVENELYQDVVRLGWYRRRPDTTRTLWAVLGFACTAVAAGLTYLLARYTHAGLVGVAAVLAGVVLVLVSRRMPARTAKGSAALARVLGFRQYLRTAEAEQLRFEERADVFSRYLPYAVVFGETDRWARAFRSLADDPRTATAMGWYVGTAGWSFGGFGDSMRSFSDTTSGAIAATAASSGGSGFGGGSSGGGFGGGGGGSW